MSTLKAIRTKCLECMGGSEEPFEMADGQKYPFYRPYKLVRECDLTRCPLHPFREGKRPKGAGSPQKPIVAFCWECLAGDSEKTVRGGLKCSQARPTRLTRQCTIEHCCLFSFRVGD
jgi:hypothetical protein